MSKILKCCNAHSKSIKHHDDLNTHCLQEYAMRVWMEGVGGGEGGFWYSLIIRKISPLYALINIFALINYKTKSIILYKFSYLIILFINQCLVYSFSFKTYYPVFIIFFYSLCPPPPPPPNKKGGGHIVFGADPVSICVASFPCVIF